MLPGKYVELLREIGLTEYEAKVYLSLVILGEATAYELSEFSGVPSSKIYNVLSMLEEKGLIVSFRGRPTKFLSRDPSETLNTMKLRYDAIFDELIRGISSLWRGRDELRRINLVKDLRNVVRCIKSILNDVNSFVKVIIDDCNIWIEYELIVFLKKLMDRGIKVFVLIRDKCEGLDDLGRVFNEAIRVSNKANFLCIIRDGKEVLKGVTGDSPIVVIYNIPEIVSLINELYDYIWENAKPLIN